MNYFQFFGGWWFAIDAAANYTDKTSEMKDVWFNLAHIYVEQKQFSSAIQMYKNAMRTFNLQSDPGKVQT